MTIAPNHNNQYLFSDHYLNNLLPQDPRLDGALIEAEDILLLLQDLYAPEKDHLADYNENQLEEVWLKLILQKIGYVFQTQASVPGLETDVKKPDHVFFPDEATRAEER